MSASNPTDKKLLDVLSELWAELSDKLFGKSPEPQLEPIPVDQSKK